MINMLIADDNIYYAKVLMDYINANNDNVRVCNIAINGEETLNLLNTKDNIDIFLLDLKMPIYTGIEVLNLLKEEKKIKYKQSCIVISGEMAMINEIIGNNIVYNYVYKSCSITNLIWHINKLICDREQSNKRDYIEQKINEELTFLNFNFSYLGTKYLKEAILYIINNLDNNFDNLKKEVYPIIANTHCKSVHNIKCNINSSVNSMYFDCENSKIINYFHLAQDKKPTIKLIINTIINHILKE